MSQKNDIPQSFNVVGSVSSSCEIRQVELNLIPAFVETHGHSTDERFYSCCTLVVTGSETSSHVLVIEYLHFKGKVFLQLGEN